MGHQHNKADIFQAGYDVIRQNGCHGSRCPVLLGGWDSVRSREFLAGESEPVPD